MPSSHSKTLPDGKLIDIYKLISILKDRQALAVPIKNIIVPSKSRRTGFSTKRFLSADDAFPLIVDEEMNIIDGRHRYFKLLEKNILRVNVKIATRKDIEECFVETESELTTL